MKRSKRWHKMVAMAWLLAPLPLIAGNAILWRGDANKDGRLTATDIVCMIKLLNEGKPAEALKANPALDANKDGVFNLKDLNTLTLVLLGKATSQKVSTTIDDTDQTNPTMGNTVGIKDEDQESPSTGNNGGGAGLKDSDMGNPE